MFFAFIVVIVVVVVVVLWRLRDTTASEINFWCCGFDLTVRPVRTFQAWLLMVKKDDF